MTDKLAPSERHAFEHGGRTVYEWNQTFQEVTVYVATPPGVRGKDLYVEISGRHVKLGIKPNPPYLDLDLTAPVKASDSLWTLEGGELTISLQKAEPGEPWASVFRGHELDPLAQQAEGQRLMLERFQSEHPGFDFSGATFNGQVPNPRTFMRDMDPS